MRKFFAILLVLSITTSIVYAMPDYNPAQRNMDVVWIDNSYNTQLLKNLEEEFTKRNTDPITGEFHITGDYHKEVIQKYNRMKIEY